MIEIQNCKLYLGDCLEIMKEIPNKSIDMILCDLPYAVLNKNNSNAQWDKLIPFDKLWPEYERIVKDNAAIVLFGSGMFTADLMVSNRKLWRYNLIWKKGDRISGFLNANRQPLRNHEDICVFFKKQCIYNPQFKIGNTNHLKGGGNHKKTQRCYGNFKDLPTIVTNKKYPISVINIDKEHHNGKFYHPTQKPVALCEYLIKTYTNENMVVLDNCMGSGTTGVACIKTKRKFIGIEKEEKYFNIAKQRIEDELKQGELF